MWTWEIIVGCDDKLLAFTSKRKFRTEKQARNDLKKHLEVVVGNLIDENGVGVKLDIKEVFFIFRR